MIPSSVPAHREVRRVRRPASAPQPQFPQHRLIVRDPEHPEPFGYLVVEATRASFAAACKYLRDTPWIDHDLAPLVCSDFRLSASDVALLPQRTPWLYAPSDVQACLRILHTALALPLEQRGLICVDFMDMVSVLINGGEARVSQVTGSSAALACDALLAEGTPQEGLSAAGTAMCLHIRAHPGFAMSDFDLIGSRLESIVHEDSLIVMSTGISDRAGVELTLLSVTAREKIARQ